MASAISAAASNTQTAAQTTSNSSATDNLANRDTFLKLLVAQIKNQNPLNPTDGVQFLSQLAQFSSLEQNLQIRDTLDAIRKTLDERLNAPAGT